MDSDFTLYETSVTETTDNEKMSFIKVPGKHPIKIPAGTTRQSPKNNPYGVAIQAIQRNCGSLPRNMAVIDTLAEVREASTS